MELPEALKEQYLCYYQLLRYKMKHPEGSNRVEAMRSVIRGMLLDICSVMDTLQSNISDEESNFTRFVCIARDPMVEQDANRVSVVMSLSDDEGSLYRMRSSISLYRIMPICSPLPQNICRNSVRNIAQKQRQSG